VSKDRRVARPLSILAAVFGVATALCLAPTTKVEAGSAPSIDLEQLGLPADGACGTKAVTFRAKKKSPEHTVFEVDLTSAQHRHCLSTLLTAAEKQPKTAPIHDFIYFQVLHNLSNRIVRFYQHGSAERTGLAHVVDSNEQFNFAKFDRVIFVNKHGLPHNSMAQAKLGSLFFLASLDEFTSKNPDTERANAYLRLGLASYGPVLDEIGEGGLRSRGKCDLKPEYKCSWFHAVTSRSRQDAPLSGGTLNKHLIATARLFESADILSKIDGYIDLDLKPTIEAYRTAAIEGVNQLSFSSGNRAPGAAPNLIDYIPKTQDGKPVKESWLYYALNPATQKPYFLKHKQYKNCRYHIIDVNSIFTILAEYGSYTDLNGLTQFNPYLGESILDFVVDTYRFKQSHGGIYTDSETMGDGNFRGCLDGDVGLGEDVMNYLSDLGPEWHPPASGGDSSL